MFNKLTKGNPGKGTEKKSLFEIITTSGKKKQFFFQSKNLCKCNWNKNVFKFASRKEFSGET